MKKNLLNDEGLLKKFKTPINKLPNQNLLTLTLIKNEIFELIKTYTNLATITKENIKLSICPAHTSEDITLDGFHLAKTYKINPIKFCSEFCTSVTFKTTKYCKSVTAIKSQNIPLFNQNRIGIR